MQTIELRTRISNNGHIQLPKDYGFAYGREAKLVVILPETETKKRPIRHPGSAKGILKILVEDAEHLDDFKEYMP
jgi:hypothetical protein